MVEHKVSIIIPTYNVEKYLRQALDSAVNQTLKDIEIICVDDCSTDNSLDILKEYAQNDDRIIILEQEKNQGQGVARNRALDIARGEYIMFLDPDDWYELNACEIAYNQISKNKNDFVIFPHYVCQEETKERESVRNRIKPFLNLKNCSNINPYELKERFFINCYTVCQIYSREFLNRYNIRYSDYRINEDIRFFVRAYLETENVSIIDTPLYYYRRITTSTSFKAERYDLVIQTRKDAYEMIKNHKNCELFMPQFLVYCTNTLINNYFKKFISIDQNIEKDFYNKIRIFFVQINNEQDIKKIKRIDKRSYKKFKRVLKSNYIFWKINNIFKNVFSKGHLNKKSLTGGNMKSQLENIKEAGTCTGCSACFNICPANAITMKENQEGFLEPVINNDKCTSCGLCARICPVQNTKYENMDKPKCYAYMADDDTRLESSSGGAFFTLASYFINNGGYVAGAVWTKDWKVKHIVSNKFEDIKKMQKSKYLQSEIGDCYKAIKTLLEDNKKVLFTGCPCQIAGLKAYLRKEYENLFCVDILCHGVPSPEVFKKYLSENYNINEIKNIDFRDKTVNGWSVNLKIDKFDSTEYYKSSEDPYMTLFLKNVILRNSCGSCIFNKLPRQGDLTIGDFWGIEDKYNDYKGTSAILSNNAKGQFLCNLLKNSAKLFVKQNIEAAKRKNPVIFRSCRHNQNRIKYFEQYNSKTVKEAYKIFNDKFDYIIVNFWDSKFNYGACITAWAMQEFIKSFGFTVKLLDTGERSKEKWYKNSYMEEFADRYLDKTRILNYKQCKALSKNIKGAILGSDQVLRIKYLKANLKKYMLPFLGDSKRKIAIAPSFGVDKEEFIEENIKNIKEKKYMTSALSTFDYLSTREISGKEIYKDVFGLESDLILDPVFLIEKDKYNEIIKNSSKTGRNKIVSYVLDNNPEYENLYKHLEEKYQKTVEIIDRTSSEYSVEDWLKLINECELLITDSFHGVCFAMIFNKPFICINNLKRGSSRLQTLIDVFGISENIKTSIDEIYNSDLQFSMDYSKINQVIESERERCLEIIRKVFLENYSNNKNCEQNKIKFKNFEEKIKKQCRLQYYKYKILSNITFGKTRKKYKDKRKGTKKILRDESFKI